MAFDYKKEYKGLYMPKATPTIVDVPEMKFIAVNGCGNPNEPGGEYQQALGILYPVAYALKMSYKTDYHIDGFFEYVVPPLEGLWWKDITASRRHHEIYLSDPRKCTPEKMKTVLRIPIAKRK